MAKQKRPGRIKRMFALLAIVAVLITGMALLRLQSFADQAVAVDAEQRTFMVESGDGFNAVLAHMRGAGIEEGHALEWKALALTMRVAGKLQVGEYVIKPGSTPRRLLDMMARGEVLQRKFTIVEGWNFRELRRALQADTQLAGEISGLDDATIMSRLQREGELPEGRFLPETYVYTRGATGLSILGRAAEAMDVALASAWEGREADTPLRSADELLTLASIVEKETALASERPLIAGVFLRRLRIGMRLQTDPTVIYGMGSAYAGNIRRSDLERDTPFNTYVRSGLPPSPIAMPGKAALLAVAHPTKGNALYFVASGDGGHQFSASLDEHNAAVRKHQLGR